MMSFPQATAQQLTASDPSTSVWVSASAGTGKTHVLTDRLLRLLLAGARPERILCLTFTRAAAAEMSNRLHERLGQWSTMNDRDLGQAITALSGPPLQAFDLDIARRLFATVLEAPGGLKIQTLHAFCESLLRRFPIEAGIAPHFELIDERGAAELLESCLERVLVRDSARCQPYLTQIIALVEETRFRDLMAALLQDRARILQLLREFGGIDGLTDALPAAFGLTPDEDEDTIVAEICDIDEASRTDLAAVCDVMQQGSKTDAGKAAKISPWLADPALRAAILQDYLSAFFKDDGNGDRYAKLVTNPTLKKFPEAGEILERELERLTSGRDRLRARRSADATAVLLRLGADLITEYENAKQRSAELDYDDLILRARDLLLTREAAQWVLYKLDGGLDHILIDEAQDTNPEQWQVVKALSEEFFAGAGASEAQRSVFAVGDTKQSIYSFQRAAPEAFETMRHHFEARAGDAGKFWHNVELALSYRSTPAILSAVDAVFEVPAARRGVIFDDKPVRHVANRSGDGGLVEIWPVEQPLPVETGDAWSHPLTPQSTDETAPRLAGLIADRIRNWLESGHLLEAYGRPVRPGDILILVQKRAPFVEVMVRELKRRGVPVAGVDRMILTDQLAVMDLIALGHFLLLPDDDLTLATVLKSPLFGLNDDDLFEIAHNRRDSLWTELQRHRNDNARFAAAAASLSELLARVDFVRPFELYSHLLGPGGGRRRMLSRLGPDANDPMNEFLSLALFYEREHAPSLQGFLAWLEAADTEVKRDQEQRRDEVRVMTVHGAKGLQAPIVFLADTCRKSTRSPEVLWGGAEETDGVPLWRPLKELENEVLTDARQAAVARQDEEYRRLLYVALTRAQDRLYITGFEGKQKRPVDSWYDMIWDTVTTLPDARPIAVDDDPERQGWRLTSPQTAAIPEAQESEKTTPQRKPPAWLEQEAPPEPIPSRPLSPSRPSDDEQPVQSPLSADDGDRFLRGNLIHRLLQVLPDLPAKERASAADRFLSLRAGTMAREERAEIAAEVLHILQDSRFSALFSPESRAEVAVAGKIGEHVVSGQIDRLAVTDSAVMIVDYKTNRTAPSNETDVPTIYLRQMAAYRALLMQIYPEKSVTCALLWTHGAGLMPLSGELLDAYTP